MRIYTHRLAATIVEIIIVITIIGILVSLLLPALVKVRQAALRMDDSNRLKQITLATSQLIDANNGELPFFKGKSLNSKVNSQGRLFPAIRNFVWRNDPSADLAIADPGLHEPYYKNRWYQSPSDPSFDFKRKNVHYGTVSYVGNEFVFRYKNTINQISSDGLSNTIFFTTHYAKCGIQGFTFWDEYPVIRDDSTYQPPYTDRTQIQLNVTTGRRASFADRLCGDTYPVPSPTQSGVTIGQSQFVPQSRYHKTMFQLAPKVEDCNPFVPNSFYPDGLLTAFGDGSVRFMKGTVAEPMFWAAVTPSGGEVFSMD